MVTWHIVDTWIIINAIIVGISSTLVGTHLVLKRESLMADAISHAVLPGIAIGYFIAKSQDSILIFIGAMAIGILTAMLTGYITHEGKVENNASLGVVFSGLFAIGLILINVGAKYVDIDPNCVLFGAIELTPLDTITIAGWELPRAVSSNGIVMFINIAGFLLFSRIVTASAFDPQFSHSIGIPVRFIRYIHVVLLSITTVAAFESVGSILVIALLIVPPVIGWLVSSTIKMMVIIALVVSVLSSILGHIFAIYMPSLWNRPDVSASTTGSIVVILAIFLILVVLFSPKVGLVIRAINRLINEVLVASDDILKDILYAEQHNAHVSSVKKIKKQSVVAGKTSALSVLLARLWLIRKKLMIFDRKDGYVFTQQGKEKAQVLQEKHRFWEEYLYERGHMNPQDVHQSAEQLEHATDKMLDKKMQEQSSDGIKIDIPGHKH